MQIRIDDLEGGDVLLLLEEHLADMYAVSPPESVHALDVVALKDPGITFFSAWQGEQLQGCVAIKELDNKHAELKSMRTTASARNKGVASGLLQHTLAVCNQRGYEKVSLETGSMDYFLPARRLYEKFGFNYCDPFGSYQPDPLSAFMTLEISR